METFTKVISMQMRLKEKELLVILKVSTKATLRMERYMGMVFTKEKMECFSEEDFRMVSSHKASLYGDLDINTPIKVC